MDVFCGDCRPNWRHITLMHDKPLLFVTSQWNLPHGLFVLYRVTTLLYWIIWTVLSGLNTGSAMWFIYLTNWALLTLDISLLLKTFSALHALIAMRQGHATFSHPELPLYIKIQWVFSNVALVAAAVAVSLFWLLEWDGSMPNAVSINVHAVNIIFLILDLFIVAQPLHFLHVYHSMMFAAVYAFVNAIYQDQSGDPVYAGLDWIENLGMSLGLSLGIIFLAVPLIWLIFFGLYKLRLYINRLYCCSCRKNGPGLKVIGVSVSPAPTYVNGSCTSRF